MSVRQRSLDAVRNSLSLKPRLGAKLRTGIHIYQRDEAREIIGAIVDRGFAVATHAIGNDAVDNALCAYESARNLDRAAAPRIEHATFLSPDLVTRIADVGAAVVTQPHFMSLPAYGSAPSVPGLRNAPLRWLLDAGVTVAGSSDYPVAGFDPLDGLRSAVTRRTTRGHSYEPDQYIGLDEALALYTREAAGVCGLLDELGTLEVGKRASFVVLSNRLSANSLPELRVDATVVDGTPLHGSL